MFRHIGPKCPHCGEIGPHGDERHVWIDAHLESRIHRWWWMLKNNWVVVIKSLVIVSLIVFIILERT